MSVVVIVTYKRQTFTGRVLARGRFKTLVEYTTVNPRSERVQWFMRWRVKDADMSLSTVARPQCLHRREPCCERFGR